MARKRREADNFSLSFLDCICCGFGAIILLLVLTKIYEPVTIERSKNNLQSLIAKLQEELFQIRGESIILNRELKSARDQVTESQLKLAKLRGDLTKIRGQYDPQEDDSSFSAETEGELRLARQALTEEMQRLRPNFRRADDAPVGGIPVDSEYVVFIIDTSGSMQQDSWQKVRRKIRETLDLYPNVLGMQIMNDNGRYMFPESAGAWLKDTPARRELINRRMSNWRATSVSSPVNGIKTAIRTYGRQGKKVSLYVFGDDFKGGSVEALADAVDRLNPEDADGKRNVRIHAVGFPHRFSSGRVSEEARQFSALMRELTFRNGGTFVAVTDRS
ncbi:MAG: VWA domain-containing protein [Pseudomonadota bacterium]